MVLLMFKIRELDFWVVIFLIVRVKLRVLWLGKCFLMKLIMRIICKLGLVLFLILWLILGMSLLVFCIELMNF